MFSPAGVDYSTKLADMNENKDWNAEKDIREFPTNAFGQISFVNEGLGGHKPAKVRRQIIDIQIFLLINDEINLTARRSYCVRYLYITFTV